MVSIDKKQLKQDLFNISMIAMTTLFTILIMIGILYFVVGNNIIHNYYAQYNNERMSRITQEKDIIVQMVSATCGTHNTEIEQIKCVRKAFYSIFNYEERYDKIVLPEELLNETGDCKSATLFYKSIFNNLGISNSIHTTYNHVYNIVDLKDGRICAVDQFVFQCW